MTIEKSVFLVVRECGLAHKTIIFVLDEFDLFAQVRFGHVLLLDIFLHCWSLAVRHISSYSFVTCSY